MEKNETETGRRGFMVYYNMKKQFALLSPEQLGRLIAAMLDYSENGADTDFFDPALDMLFSVLKDRDDHDREKFDEICKSRRAAAKKGAEARWGA